MKAEKGFSKYVIISSLIFLASFIILHSVSDFVNLRVPFLALSEAVWEHMKMGIYAGMITYLILWSLRREGSLSGFSAFVIASTLSIFTYYYAIVSFISLASLPLLLHISLVTLLTWLCGVTGAIIALRLEEVDKPVEYVLVANMVALVLISIATTYLGPPIPLFTLSGAG